MIFSPNILTMGDRQFIFDDILANFLKPEATFELRFLFLARAVEVPVGWRSGSRLAMTLVATINDILLSIFSFFSVVYFSHRGSARIKKLFSES